MFLEYFKTLDKSDLTYGWDHLPKIHLKENDLESFLNKWRMVIDHMGHNRLTNGQMRGAFYRKIYQAPALKDDIERYDELDEGDPRKTYSRLVEIVERAIRKKLMRNNMLDQDAMLDPKARLHPQLLRQKVKTRKRKARPKPAIKQK